MPGVDWFIMGVGVLAGIVGLLVLSLRVRTVLRGRAAEGVVVCAEHSMQSDFKPHKGPQPTFHTVYEFRHEDRTYRCRSSFAQVEPTPVGTRVRVRYLPDDPATSAEIDTLAAMWFFPVGTLAAAAIFISFALIHSGIVHY